MNHHFRKLLVAVDGSENSLRALDMALAMAAAAGASLTILEVIEEFGPLPGYYGKPPEGVNRTGWIAEQRFEKIHPPLEQTKVLWERQVIEGAPADKICEVAGAGKYDLILIGASGHSSVGRFLMGSVTTKVVYHAPCSVTVVR